MHLSPTLSLLVLVQYRVWPEMACRILSNPEILPTKLTYMKNLTYIDVCFLKIIPIPPTHTHTQLKIHLYPKTYEKIMVKSPLCTPWRDMGEWRYTPHFLNLGTRWRWVVVSAPRSLNYAERACGFRWIGGIVDPSPGLDILEKREVPNLIYMFCTYIMVFWITALCTLVGVYQQLPGDWLSFFNFDCT